MPVDAAMPTDADFILGNEVGPELPLSVKNSKIFAVATKKQTKLLTQVNKQ